MFQEKFGDGGICGMYVLQKMGKEFLVRYLKMLRYLPCA